MTNQTQVQQWSAYEDYDGRYTVQDSHGGPVTGAEAIIASAPDLLAALEAGLRHFGGHTGKPNDPITAIEFEQRANWLDRAQELIKRARGED